MSFLCVFSAVAVIAAAANHNTTRGGCGTRAPTQEFLKVHKELSTPYGSLDRRDYQYDSAAFDRFIDISPKNIDVYIHVIKKDNDSSQYNKNIFDDQIKMLNDNFRSCYFSFTLRQPPSYVKNSSWLSVQDNNELSMKQALHIGNESALNLYYVQDLSDKAIGRARYPNYLQRSNGLQLDGCLLRFVTLTDYRTALTHEVGHWLGLMHTFQGDDCDGPGDYISDTPAEYRPEGDRYACNGPSDTCPNHDGDDPTSNYMSYSLDSCQTEFTSGQLRRMHQLWGKYRSPVVPTKPIIMINGGLPFYPEPIKTSESWPKCNAVSSGNNKAVPSTEPWCGSNAWCYYKIWKNHPKEKQYSNSTNSYESCMDDRLPPDMPRPYAFLR
ncbi:hypothetical protein QQS21_002503 [Conoideocrella luteorostrata]|uniref:Peptidase M43 pregnancy-associated plasma-A domain-containing protein n=1 Tax=Conoideocrella luteorostrata TaxID=1105319 RepID=A0AAJ0FWH3_9HYPO|nr:hypothetical protein QQS21_002503 [Conoideocrella luteorostrata]